MQFNATAQATASRYQTPKPETKLPYGEISAFDHHCHPIVTTENQAILQNDFRWGLVPPDWTKRPEAIWNRTISAKLEYLDKRYSWKNVGANRCLIPATAYIEFHWNDLKGKSKTKYIIRHRVSAIFSLAGIYSVWTNGETTLKTFAVCTTNADQTMQFVHNKDAAKNYHRMPVMLNPEDETEWLDAKNDALDFAFPRYKPDLVANPDQGQPPPQLALF